MTTVGFSPVSLEDVDHLSEWVAALGWEMESTQLSSGPNRIDYDHFVFPELVVAHFRARQAMVNHFALPRDAVVFEITRARLPMVWGHREFTPTVMGIARGGVEHTVRLVPGWDCFEFVMSENLVRRTELFPKSFFVQTERRDEAWLPLPEPQTRRVLALLDDAFERARPYGNAPGAPFSGSELFEDVIDGLQALVDGGLALRNGQRPRPTRRSDLLLDAESVIARRLREDVTTDEIAQELGVSYRVLNYAVRDAYGVSPGRYVRARKLHAARRMLRTGDVSVGHAAAAVGLFAPGRFASQYKRLFGELPSQTRLASGR